MKRLGYFYPALLALVISGDAHGAQKTITWEDGMFCRFEIKFDPRKDDEEKLKNTINVVFLNGFYKKDFPDIALDHPGGHLVSNPEKYRQACELTKDKATNLQVIDLPGIEDYRRLKLEQLEDWCTFNTLKSIAASGNPSALREYTPSVAQCSPFIDALEGKSDIRAVWRNMINSLCANDSRPEICRARFFSAENGPNPEEKIKLDVLTFGWQSCAISHLKTNSAEKNAEMMKTALEKSFQRRFRVKNYPCGD
jgi:hypothetical protein